MEYKTRIKEVIFNDGSKEYYPQVTFDCNPVQNWKTIWRIQYPNKYIRFEVCNNEYGFQRDTKEDAIIIIEGFKLQYEKNKESERKFNERLKKREDSIIEVKYFDIE